MFGRKNSLQPVVAAFLAAVLVLFVTIFMERSESARLGEQERTHVRHNLGLMRAELEGGVTSDLALLKGLTAHVGTHPDAEQHGFAAFTNELMKHRADIRAIALFHHDTLTHINRSGETDGIADVGFLEQAEIKRTVAEVRKTGEPAVVGPLAGGTILVAVAPVFIAVADSHHGVGEFWGTAVVTLDVALLLTKIERPIISALRVGDRVVLGDAEIFSNDPVILETTLREISWELAATPKDGWSGDSFSLWVIRLGGLVAALLLSAMAYRISRDHLRIRDMAMHDLLTGLPNRVLLTDRLNQLFAQSARNEEQFALLALDLDDFKPINDTHGHKIGDGVLAVVADRMRGCLRAMDTVARVGGDEFIILLPELTSVEDASNVARKVIEAISRPITVENLACKLSVSIGISLFPGDARDSVELIKLADFAMYAAKLSGKNQYNFASPQTEAMPREGEKLVRLKPKG